MKNIERKEGFSQVCVWPGTVVNENGIDKTAEFIEFMQEEFNARVQYLEEIKTLPDTEGGIAVKGTGNRNDLFFAVHHEDVGKFALARLSMGIRWIDDAVASCNGGNRLYPARVMEYKTW